MRSISAIVPVRDGARTLPAALEPLLRAMEHGALLEVLIVDDRSSDGGPELCRARGLPVLTTAGGESTGPSAARNLGVEAARGEIVLFVDADVVIRDDVPEKVREAFEADPGCVAVFGSYDDRPAERNVASLYANLRHHCVHQAGTERALTFWAGCGAVDRAAFLAAGGYDPDRFPHPSVEDVALGVALRAAGGSIRLRKDMQCTHLKRWSLVELWKTDVLRRALPWARMLVEAPELGRTLNLGPGERAKAALAGIFLVSLACIAASNMVAIVALITLAAAGVANARLLLPVARRGGGGRALAALLLHQLYYVYGALTVVYAFGERAWRRAPRARSTAAR